MKIADLFNVNGYGVVVTGGASGIGLGYAEALASNGARVTILDIDMYAECGLFVDRCPNNVIPQLSEER